MVVEIVVVAVVVVVVVVVVVIVVVVVVVVAAHAPDSSPMAEKVAMFLLRTAALLEIPSTPVGVPVMGWVTAGLE